MPGIKGPDSRRLRARSRRVGKHMPAGKVHARANPRLRLSGRIAASEPANRSRKVSGPPATFREAPMQSIPFSEVYDFAHLYEAHRLASRGKRDRREVIDFELDLGRNLAVLSGELRDGTYRLLPYMRFVVTDPKMRIVHALRYRDRVVQHSLCDRVVGPVLEPRLIYDNAACRVGKGTHFALDRLERYLREYRREYGTQGWFLKCDVHHFFASVNHAVLKDKLLRVPLDSPTRTLLHRIIDSYEDSPGRGLPLGNQTSQWFALYFLDSLDRLVKERLGVRGYVRYMDDMVLIGQNRAALRMCLDVMGSHVHDIGLSFNGKTQIAPLVQGIDFLGWHLYLSDSGKVVRRLRAAAKRRIKRKVRAVETMPDPLRSQVLQSYEAYLQTGDAAGFCRMLGLQEAAD